MKKKLIKPKKDKYELSKRKITMAELKTEICPKTNDEMYCIGCTFDCPNGN